MPPPLLHRLAKALGILPVQAGRPLVYSIPVHTYGVRGGSRAVLASYRTHGWLRLVADTVAESVATPRWGVLKPTSKSAARRYKSAFASLSDPAELLEVRRKAERKKDLVQVPGHELELLLESPSERFTGRALRKMMQLHLDLPGESFMWLRLSASGRPVGYELVPPQCVVSTPTDGNPYYRVVYGRFNGAVPAEGMVWLRHLDPENLDARGAGRGVALGDEIDTSEAIQVAQKATFQRGGMPAAMFGVDPGPDGDAEDKADALQKEYDEKFIGPDKAGKVWFVSGKASLAQIQQDFRALQMAEADKAIRDLIRQVWNVPPELVGDLSNSNRSTSENAKYVLAEHATLPRLEFLRTEWQLRLVPRVDKDALLFYADPRPQEFERVHKALTASYGPHVYMNEARIHAGLRADPKLAGVRFQALPGAMPTQDGPQEPTNPPPARGPGKKGAPSSRP